MIMKYKGIEPKIADSAYIAPTADIIGDVTIGENSSVWFGAVLRGDTAPIVIGDNTNIQDNCTVHGDPGIPTIIGNNVTVGHNAVVHSCKVGDNSLIGMNSVVLNSTVIGDNCIVGAGSLVTQNKNFEDNSLIIGSPAKALKKISGDQAERLKLSAQWYVDEAKEYINEQENN